MKISTMMSWPFGLVNNGHQMQKIALLELHISYEKRYYLKATLVSLDIRRMSGPG